MTVKKFFKSLISNKTNDSAKRFITLLLAGHFILAGFVILFLVCYMIATVPKGVVNHDLIELLKDILQNDMFVILSGLGFIGLENWAQIQLEKAKTLASTPRIVTGTTTGDIVNIDMKKAPPEIVPDVDETK